MSRRIGLLGGTFDPPHIGHLMVGVEVRHQLGLDVVLMVVANIPWQKVGERVVSPAAERLGMVELAVSGLEGLEACDVELRRGGDSFTIDTVDELMAAEPGAEVFVIVGADAARGLPTWHRVGDLAERCTLAVVERAGVVPFEPAAPWRSVKVIVPGLEVSSTDLRHRAADGRPLAPLVPLAVAERVAALGLYRMAA